MEIDYSVPAGRSEEYSLLSYWEKRFSTEIEYDWLCTFQHVEQYFRTDFPPPRSNYRVLVIGCGNSLLSAELSDAGFLDIVSTDYSSQVVANMRAKYSASHPNISWSVADCTSLQDFQDGSFDIVVEKGVLDALVASEGSVWSPNEDTRDNVNKALRSVSRVLAPGGALVSIHFQQPHFRKAYLEGNHSGEEGFGWGKDIVTFPIEAGLGFFYTRCIKPKQKHSRIDRDQVES